MLWYQSQWSIHSTCIGCLSIWYKTTCQQVSHLITEADVWWHLSLVNHFVCNCVGMNTIQQSLLKYWQEHIIIIQDFINRIKKMASVLFTFPWNYNSHIIILAFKSSKQESYSPWEKKLKTFLFLLNKLKN